MDTRDNNGLMSLHWACQEGHLEVVKYVVEKRGATVDAKAVGGWTPLHFACQGDGNLLVVKYLVEQRGATVDAKDDDGTTPLFIACYTGEMDVVKYLVQQAGASLDVKDNDGDTALDIARSNGCQAEAEFLESWLQRQKKTPPQKDNSVIGAAINTTSETPIGLSVAQDNDLHAHDRSEIRLVIEKQNQSPASVSYAYVQSLVCSDGKILGKGFFGTVVRGKDSTLGHEFAIKSINTDILIEGTQVELDKAIQTFKTEQEISPPKHCIIVRLLFPS